MTTQRITRQDVDSAYCWFVGAAQRAGLDVMGWHYIVGGGSTAWQIGTHGAPIPRPNNFGHIGRSTREAYWTLRAMAAALDVVGNAREAAESEAATLQAAREFLWDSGNHTSAVWSAPAEWVWERVEREHDGGTAGFRSEVGR